MKKEEIIAKIDKAIDAIDSAVMYYAPEFCDETKVKESNRRIHREGGYLHFYATTLEELKVLKKELENIMEIK